ncbi:ribonuclease D [Hellea balneolensis]|uniref:ribonuclease D n=1 Tax=Hellea balneolensis TaxID=287478 RepID=UPI0003FDAAE8|nr:ribonuclease D [Hellea balneolensis]
MNVITTQDALNAFCERAAEKPFMCVDTEFMRESTFYSILCLIQAATEDDEVIIDPLAEGLDLSPFNALLMDEAIIKVLHAARQDMEIFYQMCGAVPANIFDTQIAAMALGFGDSTGYGALVKGRLDINLDKGARFTDWSRRPLSEKQLKYAIADVTHLRDLYPDLVAELEEKGRMSWVLEEMAPQMEEKLYTFEPENAWERLKVRNPKKHYLAALKAAAAWRERQAIEKDIPRRRVLKDDAMYDLAQQKPKDIAALGRLRGIPRGFEKSRSAKDLVESLNAAIANADDYAPKLPKVQHMPPNLGPTIEMLKTLLRLRTEYVDIAPRMVANNADIEKLAAFGDKADVAALKGWRKEIFGDDALKLLSGKIALRLEGRKVVATDLDE